MPYDEGVNENLRFLIHEVRKQLTRVKDFFESPSLDRIGSVLSKDDYIDNLKSVIQRKCYSLAARSHDGTTPPTGFLRAADAIAVNLERIADFCENVLDQARYLTSESVLKEYDCTPLFALVIKGLDLVEKALFDRDVETALQICRLENETDRVYFEGFQRVLEELKTGKRAQSLVTVLFIFRYLERMGDSLLNIGEAVLSATLGERVKIDQFKALEDTLESADFEPAMDHVSLEHIKETKSGNRINRVLQSVGTEPEKLVIFKDGPLKKLLAERESIEKWHEVRDDIAPRIYAFHHHGERGSILFEYLPGRNFEEVLLRGSQRDVNGALKAIESTLQFVWGTTRVDEPIAPHFLQQLKKRINEIYSLHPEFKRRDGAIGSLSGSSFDETLNRIEGHDEALVAPFSVLIHGDFNIDNIIYRPEGSRIHFVDLHRSTMMDYVQDVSVFLASNHRLQVFDAPVRRKINRAIRRFFRFSLGYAEEAGDRLFCARLAMGLARSFATSTRFILDKGFAKSMFLRARYLTERLLSCEPDQLAGFELTEEILVD